MDLNMDVPTDGSRVRMISRSDTGGYELWIDLFGKGNIYVQLSVSQFTDLKESIEIAETAFTDLKESIEIAETALAYHQEKEQER